MIVSKYIGIFFLLSCVLTVYSQRRTPLPEGMNEAILQDEACREIFSDINKYRFELLVTFIDRKPNGKVRLRNYGTADDQRYYYPASVVKLPMAIAVLKTFEEKERQQPCSWKPGVICDNNYYNSADLNTLLQKMLVYSDNNSFNQLFDAVGRRELNETMRDVGMKHSRISRRFMWCSDSAYAVHPAIKIGQIDNEFSEAPSGKIKKDKTRFTDAEIGVKHWSATGMRAGSRNFSDHNYIELQELHDLIVDISTGNKTKKYLGEQAFRQLLFLMSTTPDKLGDMKTYRGITKFLYFGENNINVNEFDNIISLNIIGQAYGFMLESAYLCNLETGAEVIISVRGYFNKNDILGDDIYEYKTIGYPAFRHIARVLLDRAANRNRQNLEEWKKERFYFNDSPVTK
jgi:hypothetical protein